MATLSTEVREIPQSAPLKFKVFNDGDAHMDFGLTRDPL